MPPNHRLLEDLVSEGVSPVVVSVEDPSDREGRDEKEVGPQFLGVTGMGSGVDQQNGLRSDNQTNVLVEEFVSTTEDAFAEFLPAIVSSHHATLPGD